MLWSSAVVSYVLQGSVGRALGETVLSANLLNIRVGHMWVGHISGSALKAGQPQKWVSHKRGLATKAGSATSA